MAEFCTDPFWDWDLTWALNNRTQAPDYYGPDFTSCFQQTLLAWLPCAFLWLAGGPFEILGHWTTTRARVNRARVRCSSAAKLYHGRPGAQPTISPRASKCIMKQACAAARGRADSGGRPKTIPWSRLTVAKMVLTVGLIVVQFARIVQYKNVDRDAVASVNICTPIIRIITLILAEFLLLHARVKGIRSSGPQFIFWLLSMVGDFVPFRTALLRMVYDMADDYKYCELAVQMVQFPLTATVLVLSCWADTGGRLRPHQTAEAEPSTAGSRQQSPEEDASFLSRMLFFWFEPLLFKGYRTPLELNDLWTLSDEDSSRHYAARFVAYWQRVRNGPSPRPKSGKKPKVNANVDNDNDNNAMDKDEPVTPKGQRPKLFHALVYIFGPAFAFGAFLKLCQDCLIFIMPQVLKLLVAFVEFREETWKGVMYVFLMLFTSLLQTIFLAQYFHRMFAVAMRCKSTIMNAIYRKALLVSNAARKESTVGEIVNLMSVDAQNIMELIPFLNMLWSTPFQVGLSFYFLWQTMGVAVLAGLALLLLLIPINSCISSRVKQLHMRQMRNKDHRVKLMNEILSGIRVLKMYAWETSFENEILKIRDKEMDVLKSSAYLECVLSFVMVCSPFLVALVTSGTYVMMDPANVFDATKAFVSLTLFNIMRVPLNMLPMVISNVVKAGVSFQRLDAFLNSEELQTASVSHMDTLDYPIVIQNATFAWDEEVEVLRNINVHVKEGSLIAIVGPVGSGKSSLLSAMLGELPHAANTRAAHVNTRGSIAYVAQQAWIQGATLQDNILFGKPKDAARYDRVIEACALLPDLALLPAGDQTEIGEKGVNLSGGQKQRVALARAAYNNADIYLLDDPFSALDSHVGRHVFEQLVGPKGLLRRKTRVLVTHGLTHLPLMDRIFVLNDGEITESGTFEELLEKKGDFADFLMYHMGTESNTNTQGEKSDADGDGCDGEAGAEIGHVEDEEGAALIKQLKERLGGCSFRRVRHRSSTRSATATASRRHSLALSIFSARSGQVYPTGKGAPLPSRPPSAAGSQILSLAGGDQLDTGPDDTTGTGQLVLAETTEMGRVKKGVYLHYVRSVGVSLFTLTMLFQLLSQAFEISTNIWLAEWSSQPVVNGTQDSADRVKYLGVYAALGVSQALFLILSSISMTLGMSNASNVLHLEMLERILKAPMSFFDQTPIGRIVNRFGKDVDVVDALLPNNFRDLLFCLFNVLSTLIVICYAIPAFSIFILPVALLYWITQRYYVASSRQLKRLEAVSRSPIYTHFSETVTGLSTIRGFGAQHRFAAEFEAKVDLNQAAMGPFSTANRWLAIRLETIAILIIFVAALFTVVYADQMSSGFVGLAIAYALQITGTLNWLVRMSSAVETNIVAVERIKEYSEVPQEAPHEIEAARPDGAWPEEGVITFNKYQTRYREGLDLVLNKITCKIEAGEKIGIVGRTGAGKSSMTLALFRIIEPSAGSIHIDGLNIAKLGLFDLRSRLTIIPQDPVLFSGSLRLNLDPFHQHSDGALWKVLELANLKHFVKGLQGGLQYEIAEGGENLSVGQRQQICLARALLRRTRVLVLDEATASVDLETDNLIQQTIRTEFAEATVLTIAHRLKTIMDSTRIMVLDRGTIKEFDSPEVLLRDKSSVFHAMAKDAGLA